jgi:RimJ/RimL family protein N-acetyltransferase
MAGMRPHDVIDGSRVRLRMPRLEDAGELFASVASDPEVPRYMSWRPHPDVAETRRVITEVFNTGQEHTRLIELRGNGEIAGICGWRRLSAHEVEFGYCLARRLWGQGLVPEAVGLLLDMLGRDPRVFRVSAMCHVANLRSARVLQRCGLKLEGRLVRHTVFPNLDTEPLDVLLYAKAMR